MLDRTVEASFIVRVVALEYANSTEIAGILNEFIAAGSAEEGTGGGAPAGTARGAFLVVFFVAALAMATTFSS